MIAIRDQVYSLKSGIPLVYDFFRPKVEEAVPLVALIHGGGWISGDKTHLRDEAIWLASNGFAAACMDYRLAPLHPYPAAVQDCQDFISYVRENAQELGIDPKRIATMGSSAGGHLAAMTGLLDHHLGGGADRAPCKVNVVIDLCGLTDLTEPREQHFPVAWSFIEEFMSSPYEGHEALWREASPIHHVSASDATFLIFHGEADEVVPISQSERLHEALRKVGVSSEFIRLPGEGHGFSEAGWAIVRERYVPFLKEKFELKVGA